jgi:hypothetical protein
MDNTSTAMLAVTCQAATSAEPSRIINTTGAVGTNQAENLALADRKRQVINGDLIGIGLDYMADFNGLHGKNTF